MKPILDNWALFSLNCGQKLLLDLKEVKKLRTGGELEGSYSSPVHKISEAVLGIFTTIKSYTAIEVASEKLSS